MSLSLSGEKSFVYSVFPDQLYQTTSPNLIVESTETSQSNGQVEASNKTLLMTLKKRLDAAKGKWVDELPGVLWAYRTTARRSTGISPFTLTYGMEAIIPTKIGMPMLRTDMPKQLSRKSIIKNLDTVDELRKAVAVRVASYHLRLANLYNIHVKP